MNVCVDERQTVECANGDCGLLSLLMGQTETKSCCICMGTKGETWEEDEEVESTVISQFGCHK